MPPFDEVIEATLTADGDQTILVIEVLGMPLDTIAFYGAGWQIHAENLAAYLAGRERGDTEARWDELVPPYQDLAATSASWYGSNIGEGGAPRAGIRVGPAPRQLPSSAESCRVTPATAGNLDRHFSSSATSASLAWLIW